MRAARVAWMLQYADSTRVSLLEGGFQAWKGSGYPIQKSAPTFETRDFDLRPNPKLLATIDNVKGIRNGTILDVRSQGEFNGTDGRDCDRRLGRIPRARWLEWTEFIDGHSTFRDKQSLRSSLRRIGLLRDMEIVTYCHRGARAAAAFYALRSFGFSNVKNYIGSWHEWSARKDMPVERSSLRAMKKGS